MKKSVRRILLVILGLALAAELLPVEDALCVYDFQHSPENELEANSQLVDGSPWDSLYYFEMPKLSLSWTLDEGVMDTDDGYKLVIEEYEQELSLGRFIPFYKPVHFASRVRVSFSEVIDIGSQKVDVSVKGTYAIVGDLTAYGLIAVRSVVNILDLAMTRNLKEAVEWLIMMELYKYDR